MPRKKEKELRVKKEKDPPEKEPYHPSILKQFIYNYGVEVLVDELGCNRATIYGWLKGRIPAWKNQLALIRISGGVLTNENIVRSCIYEGEQSGNRWHLDVPGALLRPARKSHHVHQINK